MGQCMLSLHFKGSTEDTLRLWAFLQRGWEDIRRYKSCDYLPSSPPRLRLKLGQQLFPNAFSAQQQYWHQQQLLAGGRAATAQQWPLDGSPAEF